MPAPGAQCRGPLVARLVLAPDVDPSIAHDAELGLRAVPAGDTPLRDPGVALLELTPRELTLSALKPASNGHGLIVRVLNPTDHGVQAQLCLARQPISVSAVRLDETPTDHRINLVNGSVTFDMPPHALRSVLMR
jgi:alpha-mannosidase